MYLYTQTDDEIVGVTEADWHNLRYFTAFILDNDIDAYVFSACTYPNEPIARPVNEFPRNTYQQVKRTVKNRKILRCNRKGIGLRLQASK